MSPMRIYVRELMGANPLHRDNHKPFQGHKPFNQPISDRSKVGREWSFVLDMHCAPLRLVLKHNGILP